VEPILIADTFFCIATLTVGLRQRRDGLRRKAQGHYEKDVKGFSKRPLPTCRASPLFQPYVNVRDAKNVSGYQYWFHRRLDYRAFAKG